MRSLKGLRAMGALLGIAGLLMFSSTALAAFPNYSDCPRASVSTCIDVQGQNGTMRINDLAVELGDSLEIRGGISIAPGGATTFIAPSGTNGFFARPILIRGGLLGFDFPGPIDDVLTTAELAGAPSDIRFDLRTFAISLPLKLHLENPFLGPHCHVGSNGSPIQLNLQTTRLGTPRPGIPAGLILDDQVSADTTFTVPGASSCGIGLGLVNGVVNLRLGLPSGSGNNSLVATNDIGLIAPILVP